MQRLFVAIELPLELREALRKALPSIAGGRPVKAEHMHLTLRFAGEVEESAASQIETLLEAATAPEHDLGFRAPGTFPSLGSGRASKVLFMGIERADALLRLQAEIEDALEACAQPREARAFIPHVTVARLVNAPTSQVQRAVSSLEEVTLPRFAVTEFVLFQSTLGEAGPTYRALRRYPLSPAVGR